VFLLAVFWFINSGYTKPMLLAFGVISVAIVVALARRMEGHDHEYFPTIMPSWRLPGYLVWMVGQIVSSNIDVAKRVWRGKGGISPVIFTTRANQKSEVAKVLYANSITMTPGTITLSLRDDVLEVHALSSDGAEELKKGEMDRRVAALESA
jgi:multicomponent Na+:H+ antiporter subunit E